MVNKSCGLHVHFGAEKMTLEQWCRIILNYAAIERAIDSVLPISRRENNNEFCASIMGQCSARVRDLYDDIKSGEHRSMNDLQRCFNYDRYHKVNVMAYDRHKTIEFRQHSGTTDYKKIKNWIDFLSALMSWSIKHEELLDNCSDIDSLPFLNKASKRFYKERANHFKSIEE